MHTSFLPETAPILEEVSIEFFEDQVPEFVAPALSRLYGNIFSSLSHLQASGAIAHSNTYVVRQGAELVTVFLLRWDKGRVHVVNEGMRIDEAMIVRLADYVFKRFPQATSLCFHAVEHDVRSLPYPCHRYNFLEDIVVALPRTEAEYFACLGKSTQRYLTRYLTRSHRDFPTFSFEIYPGKEVQPQQIRSILELYKNRMAGKKQRAEHGEERLWKTLRRLQFGGFIGVIKIDGIICAGTINFSEANNHFMEVLAHDPSFNAYRLGTLCCYLTICEGIRQGGREYHFLWGEYEYKYRLRGVKRKLDHLAVYRSRAQVARDLPLIAARAAHDGMRRVLARLRQFERQPGLTPRLVGAARSLARALRA